MPTVPDSPEPTRSGGRVSARAEAVRAEGRCPVLAPGRGTVSTCSAEPGSLAAPEPVAARPVSGPPQRHGAGAADVP